MHHNTPQHTFAVIKSSQVKSNQNTHTISFTALPIIHPNNTMS